jgi:hypothetical protein
MPFIRGQSSSNRCCSIPAIFGNLWQFWQFQPPHPLPPGFHPIPPKVTQYTQGSAEGHNPKIQKPGVKAGFKKRIVERRHPRLRFLVSCGTGALDCFTCKNAALRAYKQTRNYINTIFLCCNKNLRPSACKQAVGLH